jgi:cytochrome c oxidase assembly factor CtaG
VYSRPIKVYQGIDNPIQVVIKNQEQKKANVSAYRVQVDIQDFTNNVTVWSGNVSFDANLGGNIQQGLGVITITSATLANLEQRLYNLTTRTISNTNVQRPVYIDDNHGAVLDLEVLPGYLNP